MANKKSNVGQIGSAPPRPKNGDSALKLFLIDFEKIKRSDALLRLPGESSGADSEVQLALSLSLPVFYSFKDLFASDIC
jgi:hypothetical protein